jgi:hypothetical protein
LQEMKKPQFLLGLFVCPGGLGLFLAAAAGAAAGHAAVAASVADHDGSAGVATGGVAHVIEVPMALMMQIGLR